MVADPLRGFALQDDTDIADVEIAEGLAPGRAMRVAHALKARDGEDFAKPGNLVEVRFVRGQSLSLTAARLLALMILTAGGDGWQPIAHKMRKSEIRRGHKGCLLYTSGSPRPDSVRNCGRMSSRVPWRPQPSISPLVV